MSELKDNKRPLCLESSSCDKDDNAEPDCKASKKEEKGETNGSLFEQFLLRSSNMPEIWENVMLNLSGTDVANCMRVCKSLRSIIAHSIKSSSNFRHKMDAAATASAVNKVKHQAQVKVDFNCVLPWVDKMSALNGVYYKKRCNTTTILKIGPSGEMLQPIYLSYSDKSQAHKVFPTRDNSFVYVGDEYGLYRLEIGKKNAEIKPDPSFVNGFQECRPTFSDIKPLSCLTYRLFIKYFPNNSEVTIIMCLLNNQGEIHESVTLYHFKVPDQYNPLKPNSYLKHLSSNEEMKMVMLLPHLIAVHSDMTGCVLWRKEHNYEIMPVFLKTCSLFITKFSTGYHAFGLSEIMIYDTATGEQYSGIHDYSLPVKTGTTIEVKKLLVTIARGPYICYKHQRFICVVKVTGKKLQYYYFKFPWEHFVYVKKSLKKTSDRLLKCQLYGFLGKSNILIGSISIRVPCYYKECYPALFSLDLDAAIRAKNEEQTIKAFCAPLVPQVKLVADDNKPQMFDTSFKQVYKTDEATGFVDIVGIMRKTGESEVTTHLFKTQMECAALE